MSIETKIQAINQILITKLFDNFLALNSKLKNNCSIKQLKIRQHAWLETLKNKYLFYSAFIRAQKKSINMNESQLITKRPLFPDQYKTMNDHKS